MEPHLHIADQAESPETPGVSPWRVGTGPWQRRAALAVALVSLAGFSVAARFATTPLRPTLATIPVFNALLVMSELVVTALLYGQFVIARSAGLLLMATAYAFMTIMTTLQTLAVPGVIWSRGFPAGGLGGQAWLYILRHPVLPALVCVYARLEGRGRQAAWAGAADRLARLGDGRAIAASLGVALLAALALAALVAIWLATLPEIPFDGRSQPSDVGLGAVTALLCLISIVALWRRRTVSILDLWLSVAMVERLFNIVLATLVGARRFDLAWYASGDFEFLSTSIVLVALVVKSAAQYRRLSQWSQTLRASNSALERMALHDGLTGLANRRYFDLYLANQIAIARRRGQGLALILCDVDAFKSYNDAHGHQAGDDCLVRVAAALNACARRPADLVARYGGEEFAIILPDTDPEGAARVAETALAAVGRLEIPHRHSPAGPHVSISGGVAILAPDARHTAADLIAAADACLFQAKTCGRNRMVGPGKV